MKNMDNEKDTKTPNVNFLEDYEDVINKGKLNTFSVDDPNRFFHSLANPRFLGSYHMKRSMLNKNTNINNLFKENLQLKYIKSLRSIIFNPLTIALIILAVLFNFFWLFYTLT
jgi:hypothetical protein